MHGIRKAWEREKRVSGISAGTVKVWVRYKRGSPAVLKRERQKRGSSKSLGRARARKPLENLKF